MSRDFKKENQGKKSKSYLLGPLVNKKRAIVDLCQEAENEDPAEEEVEVAEVEDTPKVTKKKKRRNPLTSQKIKCYNCQKMGHFADECYANKKKKGKEEKVNVDEEAKKESALMMAISYEYWEILLQGASKSYDNCHRYLGKSARSHITRNKSFFQKVDEN